MFQSIRSVLTIPMAYNLWWNVVGGPLLVKVLVREYLRPAAGARILEIGCGPGLVLGYLPEVEYLGFDLSPEYIQTARKRFPKAQFVCERVSHFNLAKEQSFDAVLAFGVVHHLDDEEAGTLFQIAHDALKPGGKLITIDGVWDSDQSPVARWVIARDRGEHVRNKAEYMNLATQAFADVTATIRHDLIRIPYSHLILECVH